MLQNCNNSCCPMPTLINKTCKPKPAPKFTFPIFGMYKKFPNTFHYELACGLFCHRSALIDLSSETNCFPPSVSLSGIRDDFHENIKLEKSPQCL